MSDTLTATQVDGSQANVRLDRSPDSCPLCHTSVHPKRIHGVLDGSLPLPNLHVAYQCTKHDCREMFIGVYRPSGVGQYFLAFSAPFTPIKQVVPQTVAKVSPLFEEIFNQSMAAEAMGLNQLTGIGLRKALEFLVKDFVMAEKPKETEAILKTTLGQCIKQFVDDERIKSCAQRAAWLGNDETHYLRKWQDQDLEDLKVLLRLTVNWVESVLLTKHYVDTLPEAPPS